MTAPCQRFARDGALALERGELDEAHLAGCADCRAARDDYLAVARAVTLARDTWHPPAGWESRLDRTLAHRAAAARRRRVWIGAAATMAIAAALVVVVVGLRDRGDPGDHAARGPASLAMTTVRGDDVRRTDSPRVGDRLQLRATAGGRRHAELRVYRAGNELMVRCVPDAAATTACRRDGDRLEADLPLPAIGVYRVVLVVGSEPPPEPQGSFDADTAAARRQGAQIVLSDPLDVL